jgi:hypothetical protein
MELIRLRLAVVRVVDEVCEPEALRTCQHQARRGDGPDLDHDGSCAMDEPAFPGGKEVDEHG